MFGGLKYDKVKFIIKALYSRLYRAAKPQIMTWTLIINYECLALA